MSLVLDMINSQLFPKGRMLVY